MTTERTNVPAHEGRIAPSLHVRAKRSVAIGTVIALVAAGFVIAVVTGWGALVLNYLAPGSRGARSALAWGFVALGLVMLGALVMRRARRPAAVAFATAFALVLVVWGSATPSNSRDWQSEVAVLPYAVVDGDRVTVHNIRNFDYRTENYFTSAYSDRTFDLRRLDRVDLAAVYWMGPAIAHLFLTFGFGDDHLAISIEARKSRTTPYATLPGFFRQYELVYVVADERDVIRVRTNYRKSPPEEVYVFRTIGPIENARRIFLDYIRDINELREHPRFYNTLTTNCTTMILAHAAVNPGHVPYSWKVLFSGYAPEYVYERGRLDRSLPFEDLKRRSHINAVARPRTGHPTSHAGSELVSPDDEPLGKRHDMVKRPRAGGSAAPLRVNRRCVPTTLGRTFNHA